LGLPASGSFDGIDLAPTWAQERKPLPKRLLFSEASRLGEDGRSGVRRMVRDGNEKLTTEHSARAELYDLRHDPGEQQDLAQERPGRVAELQAALAEHASERTRPETNEMPLSDAEREMLESLGYVE
jgi:arylsulfatase A-like enzyme